MWKIDIHKSSLLEASGPHEEARHVACGMLVSKEIDNSILD